MIILRVWVCGATFLFAQLALALCPKWSAGEKKFELDEASLPEASGLAVSAKNPGSFFHVNDSGDGPFIYRTDAEIGKSTKIAVTSYVPTDIEDLAYGPCGKHHCIILADTGDNDRQRKFISLVSIEEPEQKQKRTAVQQVVRAMYPDGAHNTEAVAQHPNGDIFLVTKEKIKNRDMLWGRVYRLPKSAWQEKSDQVRTLEFIGNIKVKSEKLGKKMAGRSITGMDIHPSGRRFVLMTYRYGIEFGVDLTALTADKTIDAPFSLIDLPQMPKHESVAYSPDGQKIYFTSESNAKKVAKARKKGKLMEPASLFSLECLKKT